MANHGTLFLDEIGNMPLAFQEKILRVVEYGTFMRVGGTEERRTNAQIIAATNRHIQQLIGDGKLMADLSDRFSFETISVPPLRDREGDIAVLSNHFLEQFGKEAPAFSNKTIGDDGLEALNDYHFPGNVRELKNIIERAAYRDTTNEISAADIGMLEGTPVSKEGKFHARVGEFSRQLIAAALEESQGNQAAAARQLGLPYHQFRYYHKKWLA